MEVPVMLTACILMGFFADLGHCCDPAEIGQEHTIYSLANVPFDKTSVWQTGNLNTLYDSSESTPNMYPELYVGTRTQLIIKNVTKNDGALHFNHFVNLELAYTCTLPVYKRASTPSCEPVELIGSQIRTKCTTAEVYPQAKCQFTLQNGGIDRRNITDGTSKITYTHTDPQPGGNEYYSTSCTLQYPVDGFKPGNWTVQVNMYPDLTGVSLAQGTVGQVDNTLHLSRPTVNISPENCPKGLAGEGETNVKNNYVRQGARASCLCARAHAGNPPGSVEWSSTNEGSFTDLSHAEDPRIIQITSPDNFTCMGKTVLNVSPHFMTYTPKYAYGPSSASLNFQRPGPIYLCPNQETNIDITCEVPANSFSPATLFTIKDGKRNNLVTKVAGDDAWYKSVNYSFNTSGQHTFTCRVENAVFSDIFSEAPASPVQVYEPPSEAPKISSRSSQNGDILVEGDDVVVTCDVSGGYPTVQSITLICGQNQSVTSNQTSASLTLTEIKPSYNETNCTCQATHVTECYDLIGSHTLIVMRSNQTRIPQEESPPIGAAVGGAIGAFFVVAVVVGGIFFTRRRMKKKEHHRADDEVFIENVVYGTAVQDYTAIKTTIQSATAPPKNYNPESLPVEKEDNHYENVKLDRKSLVKTSSKTKPALAAKPKYPGTSVKTKAVQKSSEKDQNNPSGETEYTTVDKTKTEHSQSSDHDQIFDITSAGASGEIPEIPDRHYNPEEIKDSVNEPSTSKPSKGNKKNIKEKTIKKEKEKKDKKEKKKKGKNKDEDHVYSNKTFDQSGDGEVYANIGTSMKSSTDVDDGMHKNKDGLVYTTIVGVGSLTGVQRPVNHQRKEAPVDYADIDFNKIVANREDMN